MSNINSIISSVVTNSINNNRDYIFGFANMKGQLIDELSVYSGGISIGKKINEEIVDLITDSPVPQYQDCYNSLNFEITELLKQIAASLQKHNISCLVIPPIPEKMDKDEQLYFNKNLRYKLSHKYVATSAGLGWIGKTSLFISRDFGPRVRLGSILVKDVEFDSSPCKESLCGDCDLCVKACPVQAANGKLWNVGVDRDEFLDVQKCRKHIYRNYYDKNILLCGNCIAACPVGK